MASRPETVLRRQSNRSTRAVGRLPWAMWTDWAPSDTNRYLQTHAPVVRNEKTTAHDACGHLLTNGGRGGEGGQQMASLWSHPPQNPKNFSSQEK